MSTLPKLETPKHTCTVPSTGKEAVFRPFLVKEEKLLLMAQQGGKKSEMAETILDVIDKCFFEKLDVSKLTPFDVDYLFVQLRMKSVGEVSELKYKCKNKVPSETEDNTTVECGAIIDHNLDLSQVTVDVKETNKVIQLDDNVGLKVVYPPMKRLMELSKLDEQDAAYETIVSCIDSVYTGEQVIDVSEVPKDELYEFIDNMPRDAMKEIRQFVDNMPKAHVTINTKCPKCGNEETHVASGLKSFF